MAKFHISNDGNVRSCRAASEDTCRAKGLGGRHFDSAEEGREAVEKILGGAAPKPVKKETKLDKLKATTAAAKTALADVTRIHGKKLKEFEKVESEIRANALGGKTNSNELIADYTRLQAEVRILDKERTARNNAFKTAERFEGQEQRKVNPPRPVYSEPSHISYGGCGGRSGGC